MVNVAPAGEITRLVNCKLVILYRAGWIVYYLILRVYMANVLGVTLNSAGIGHAISDLWKRNMEENSSLS